ncbi:MAG: hypothetical protein AAGI01_16390 [Myxococcota bacterium]
MHALLDASASSAGPISAEHTHELQRRASRAPSAHGLLAAFHEYPYKWVWHQDHYGGAWRLKDDKKKKLA